MHTLRYVICFRVGVSLSVYCIGCGRPRTGTGRSQASTLFIMWSAKVINPFALGACGQRFIAITKYTHDFHITTVEEVKDFFHHIVFDLDINVHPDDDFKEYVNYETGERTMNDEQAEIYNRLMEEFLRFVTMKTGSTR